MKGDFQVCMGNSEGDQQNRIENFGNLLEKSEKEMILTKILNKNDIITIKIGFNRSFCHYFEDISLNIEIEWKYEGLAAFFDYAFVNFNENEYNKKIELSEMRKEGNSLKTNGPKKQHVV